MTQILSFDEDSIMTSEIIAVIESRGALIEKCMAKLEDMSKLCFFSTSDSHETFVSVQTLWCILKLPAT
ncbi:hypothetical protein SO694_00094014 [Aureococcus anophagefferens]|uniref:Uncharacterized protein n=1 Tax=Aureococcus anophagefferens TaxID=44056 RepID=A0ABR1FSI6_AURAN